MKIKNLFIISLILFLSLFCFLFFQNAKGDVSVPSGTNPTYSHWDFNRTNIYKLRNLYLGDSSSYTMLLKAPDSLSDDNTVFQLPDDNGFNNYYLKVDGNGVTRWDQLNVDNDPDAVSTLGLSSTDDVEHKSLTVSGSAGAGFLELQHQSSEPSSPTGTDDIRIFTDTGKVYTKDNSGIVREIGSGSGSGTGEISYITNPSATDDLTGWTESTDGAVDISRTDTASELPRPNTTGTGIKIVGTAAATGEYAAFDYDLDSSDLSKIMKISWFQKPISGYSAGDYEVVIYDLDNTSEIIPNITDVPNYTGEFTTTWVSDSSSTNYELRIKSTVATTNGVVISNIIVGPGTVTKAIDPRWPSYDESEVTITDTNWTTAFAKFIPFQDSQDNWYLNYTIYGNYSVSTTSADLVISGVSVSNRQASAVSCSSTSKLVDAFWNETDSHLKGTIITGTAGQNWKFSGFILLDSKPTWATKTAPDIYLAGMPEGYELQIASAYLSSNQTGLTSGTVTQINFNQENYDEQNIYDSSSTYRITPTKQGKYIISWSAYIDANGSSNNSAYSATTLLYKNGSTVINYGTSLSHSSTGFFDNYISNGYAVVEANGTTDYFDVRAVMYLTSSTWNIIGNSSQTYFTIQQLPDEKYWANAITGFNTATGSKEGLVKKNRFETKTLASDWTTNTADITGLTFTGLTVGRFYRISGSIAAQLDAATAIMNIYVFSGSGGTGTVYSKILFYENSDETHYQWQFPNIVFEADSTSLYFRLTSAAETNDAILGDGTAQETSITLEELNNYEETTDF